MLVPTDWGWGESDNTRRSVGKRRRELSNRELAQREDEQPISPGQLPKQLPPAVEMQVCIHPCTGELGGWERPWGAGHERAPRLPPLALRCDLLPPELLFPREGLARPRCCPGRKWRDKTPASLAPEQLSPCGGRGAQEACYRR